MNKPLLQSTRNRVQNYMAHLAENNVTQPILEAKQVAKSLSKAASHREKLAARRLLKEMTTTRSHSHFPVVIGHNIRVEGHNIPYHLDKVKANTVWAALQGAGAAAVTLLHPLAYIHPKANVVLSSALPVFAAGSAYSALIHKYRLGLLKSIVEDINHKLSRGQ